MIGQTNAINKINGQYEQLVNYTMLYDYGDECEDVTGGWDKYNTNTYNYYNSANMATKNSNYINVSTSGGGRRTYSLFTNNFMDFASFPKVFIKNSWTQISNKVALWYMLSDNPSIGQGSNYCRYIINGLGGSLSSPVNNVTGDFCNCIDLNDFHDLENNFPSLNNVSAGFVWDYENAYSNLNSSIFACALLKQDNWRELCTIAGLNSSDYTDEATLCSNSTAINAILSNEEAVIYMIKSCTGSFMGEFLVSNICLTVLNNCQLKTIVMANEHWAKFLNMVA